MKYVALLRGINVGGKNLLSMAALRDCLEAQGFNSVATYIQSGNVIFDAPERSAARVIARVERTLADTFGFAIPIVMRSAAQMHEVVEQAPATWKRQSDLRCNVAFLRPPLTAARALKEVDVKPGVDVVTAGAGVLYMSTPMVALESSRLNRLAAKPIYRDMTIRNYNTCQKILALMAG